MTIIRSSRSRWQRLLGVGLIASSLLAPVGMQKSASAFPPPEKIYAAGSGSWFTPTNWSPNGLPTTGELAMINNSAVSISGAAASSSMVYVGFDVNTTGSLTITNGGSLFSAKYPNDANSGSIASRAGSRGTVNVGGGVGTSTWTNEGIMVVGVNGIGTLNITGGGVVSATASSFGRYTGGQGTANVGGGTGTSTWNLDGYLVLGGGVAGQAGVGTVNITRGGTVNCGFSAIGYEPLGSGSVNVGGTGGTSTWNSAGETAIGAYGVGTATIQTGGVVNSGVVEVALGANSVGAVLMNGGVGGASWTTTEDYIVGYEGIGSLTMTDGSNISSKNGVIGHLPGSVGTVTVGGGSSHSVWTNSESLFVGSQGTASLMISTRGTVVAAALDGGSGLKLNGGTLRITGTDAAINAIEIQANGGTIDVSTGGTTLTLLTGMNGAGGLTKAGAGTLELSAANSYSGSTFIGAGTLLMGGPNALPSGTAVTVQSGATFDMGGYGQTIGSLAGAGAVKMGLGYLSLGATNASTTFSGGITGTGGGGLNKNGTGTFTLTGANSYTGDTLVLGGSLTITDGGSLANASGYLGLVPFNIATVNVGGGIQNSSWTNSGNLHVGFNWTGTLNINAGGTVSAAALGGGGPGSSINMNGGTLRITGTDSASNVINLQAGGGALEVTAGNTFTLTSGMSGAGGLNKTGTGTLLLTGASSYTGTTYVTQGKLLMGVANGLSSSTEVWMSPEGTFDLAGFEQFIGSLTGTGTVTLGTATLRVGGNGASTAYSGSITGGAGAGLTKTGSSTLTLAGSTNYGGQTMVANGTLAINSSVSDAAGQIGIAPGLTGTVNVNAGGTWTNSSDVTVGSNGSGVLNISGGGSVTNARGFLGNNSGLVGTVNVGGGTGTANWTNSGELWVGLGGTGTLNITTGGMVTAATLDGGNVTSNVNLNGGTLRITSTDSASNRINLQANGGIIEPTGAGNTFTITSVVNGAGQLTKSGAGTLALGAANLYSGGTTVAAGKLLATNVTGSATSNGSVVVAAGATLGGGNAAGTQGFLLPASGQAVTINGTLAPGNGADSIGVLTIGATANVTSLAIPGDYVFSIATTNAGSLTALNNGNSSAARTALTGNNLLTVRGTSSSTVSFLGATIVLDALDPTLGGNWDSFRFYSWQLATLPEGVTPNLGSVTFDTTAFAPATHGGNFSLSFVDASNSVFLNFAPIAVPEPSVICLLGAIAGAAGWYYRRTPLNPSESKPLGED